MASSLWSPSQAVWGDNEPAQCHVLLCRSRPTPGLIQPKVVLMALSIRIVPLQQIEKGLLYTVSIMSVASSVKVGISAYRA